MQRLKNRGYTTVSLDEASDALAGRRQLPAKPVVITFDDGFAPQQTAVPILRELNFKATFYIINGGQASDWCIGAWRRPGSCGDAYLTWDQIRQLDRDPLFTIGFHTVDHPELAKHTEAVQRFQIIAGKAQIEDQLGHSVKHFCYPYGSFNHATLSLVKEAGFLTATTTLPGTYQPAGARFTLRRIRDTAGLP
jgi:peptidoglycan/xylan/chitin deacetylase (PgdA/CDA1 family)